MRERECVRERQRVIDDNDDTRATDQREREREDDDDDNTRATDRARLIVYFF